VQLKPICPFTSEELLPPFVAVDVIIVCFGIRELWIESKKLKMKSNKISHMMARSEPKDSLNNQDKSQRQKRDANVNNNTPQSITSVPRAGIGAFPSAIPSLPPAFTFIAVSPIAPVATFPTRGFLAPNGLLQNAFEGITPGFTGRLFTTTAQKQVDFQKPERPKIQKQIARLPLNVSNPKTFLNTSSSIF